MKVLKKIVSWVLTIALSLSMPLTIDVSASTETLSQSGSSAQVKVTTTVSGTFEVIIPKQIDMNGVTTAEANISAKGDICATQTLKLAVDKTVSLSSSGKESVPALVSLSKETFTSAELAVGGLSAMTVSVSGITAGEWTGTYNVYVSIESSTQGDGGEGDGEEEGTSQSKLIITDANGTNLNGTANVIADTSALMAKLDASGLAKSEDISMVVDINCDSFEGLATMKMDVSSFANDGEQVAIYHYDESAGAWEYITTATVVNGYVTAQFDSFSPVAFKVIREVHSHTYQSSITKDATCTETGIKTYTCGCGHSYTENIPAKGHAEVTNTVNASCTANGKTTVSCSTCSEVISETVIPSTGHEYTSTVTEGNCTEGGRVHYDCKNCDNEYDETIPAVGHTYTEGNYTVDVEPTCTTAGSKSVHCNVCGAKIGGTEVPVPATGHSYNQGVVTKEATCTADGVKTFTCACGHSYTEPITKLGHDYKSVTTAPNCTEEGYTTHTCTRCSHSYTDSKVSIAGHSYGDYTTTKNATCTTDGSKQRTCSKCGHVETAVITELGHDYSSTYTTDVAPTCTTAGSKSQHCSRCSSTQNATPISATGHSYGTASYTWSGYTSCTGKRTCATCGNVETVSATITNAVTSPATCTTNGVRTYTAKFSNSAYTTQTKPETILATGHTPVDGTCTTCKETVAGMYDSSGVMLASWDELENDYSFDVEANGGTPSNLYFIMNNNASLKSATKIVIPEGKTKIGSTAFCACSNLTSIVIPESVTSIGTGAFLNCSKVTSLNIPKSVTRIESGAFSGCSNLTSITIPNGVTYIGSSAFFGCSNLTSITIPNGVTTIEANAFGGCTGVNSISIPSGVTTIGSDAFKNVPHITYYGDATGSPWGALSIN